MADPSDDVRFKLTPMPDWAKGYQTGRVEPESWDFELPSKKPGHKVQGVLDYWPPDRSRSVLKHGYLVVEGMTTLRNGESMVDGPTLKEGHQLHANESLPVGKLRELVRRIAAKFPQADELYADRVTGVSNRKYHDDAFQTKKLDLNRVRKMAKGKNAIGMAAAFLVPYAADYLKAKLSGSEQADGK